MTQQAPKQTGKGSIQPLWIKSSKPEDHRCLTASGLVPALDRELIRQGQSIESRQRFAYMIDRT